MPTTATQSVIPNISHRWGGKVTRPAGPMKFGGSVIAFVEDPDGYKIEFIQKAEA